MASLWSQLTGRMSTSTEIEPARSGLDDYVGMLNQWGGTYGYGGGAGGYGIGGGISTTLGGGEERPAALESIGASAFMNNGVVFACMLVRMLVLSSIRFTYQRLRNGAPADFWGDGTLQLLETPWPGGTTQDMLLRMVQDADLTGNAYIAKEVPLARIGGDNQPELFRLPPDGVTIVMEPRVINGGTVGYRKVGYLYNDAGASGSASDAAAFPPDEVAHWAPTPDPMATYRGMSWLTPAIRSIEADRLMTLHQSKFFENGATPNIVIKHPPEVGPDEARAFRDLMDLNHRGAENAYKTLHLGGGADLTVVGRDMEQTSFSVVQGHGETRIAADAGIPPVIVGLSEGLQAATYSNYGQARRRFADGTCHPLWENMAGSIGVLFNPGPGSRLWYDARGVPFLREDESDAATIFSTKAGAVQTLINTGYDPDAVILAVDSGDLRQLSGKHSGLVSVQLQEPGAGAPGAEPGSDPNANQTDPAQQNQPAPGGNSNG